LNTQKKLPVTVPDMIARLEAKYKYVDVVTNARDQLYDLTQRSSVVKYNELFEAAVLQVKDMTEEEAIHKYTHGLKHHIKV
jgi:phage portal protein BeeE